MAFLLLRTFVSDLGNDTYFVTESGYETDTRSNESYPRRVTRNPGEPAPGEFIRPTAELAGSFCDGRNRLDVYHSAAEDGTARTVLTADAPECAIPQPTPPGNGAPLGGTLLLAQCDPDGGTVNRPFLVTEYWFDPARLRAANPVVLVTYTATACAAFSRATDRLVAAFCLDPGLAPFTERQLYHDGFGGLSRVDVPGAAACQLAGCSLTVTGVDAVPEILGSDGAAAVAVSGAVGAVSYSLDDFTTSQPPGDFFNLLAGPYYAFVREERAGGCQAVYAFTVPAEYTEAVYTTFVDADDTPWRISFLRRAYDDVAIEVLGAAGCLQLSWGGDATDHVFDRPLWGSSARIEFLIEDATASALDLLFAEDERQLKVEVYRGAGLYWSGYLLPDQFSAPYLSAPYQVTYTATDGFKTWPQIKFANPMGGRLPDVRWSQLQILQHIFALGGLALPVGTSVNLYADGMASGPADDPLQQAYHDLRTFVDEKGQPLSCAEVATAILNLYGAQLLQWGGQLLVERLWERGTQERPRRVYSPAGVRLGAVPNEPAPVAFITPPPGNATQFAVPDLFWVTGGQRIDRRGAVGEVVLTHAPVRLFNLVPEAREGWPEPAFLDGGGLRRWLGAARHQRQAGLKASDAAALRLSGAGTDPTAYLQTPALVVPPVSVQNGGLLRVTVVAEWLSDTPPPAGPRDGLPFLGIAVQRNGKWLREFNQPPLPNPFIHRLRFERNNAKTTVELLFYLAGDSRMSLPIQPGELPYDLARVAWPGAVRLYPVAGDADVLVHELRVEVDGEVVDITRSSNRGRNTVSDNQTSLRLADTNGGLFYGSVRVADASTDGWREEPGDAPVPAAQLLVRDRRVWQAAPADVLTGTLRGVLQPNRNLTDPTADVPAVYGLTAAALDAERGQWEITCVQRLDLLAPLAPGVPPPAVPARRLLLETGSSLLLETDGYTLLQNA